VAKSSLTKAQENCWNSEGLWSDTKAPLAFKCNAMQFSSAFQAIFLGWPGKTIPSEVGRCRSRAANEGLRQLSRLESARFFGLFMLLNPGSSLRRTGVVSKNFLPST
jgi:hypothetical protein